ncbi:hypothetical protein K1T71_001501 [Dendrolimus kikuchii]|uniref:Uncharacterized protein n=1 Tax=Dendrolimus kikuchii TaxID=765133 RepID=A0ACC1DHY8_9NEOP|nr:hypothetical protein K1T71_001501 [Dendrolimus kikuchii]
MLHRSSSSRRRRASRSAATSPQARSPRASAQPSRRASLAATETDEEMEPTPQRSPRASLAPDAALDYHRSPRHSLAPEPRSARNSMTPDAAMQMRNSLAPSRNNLAVDMNYGSRLSLNPQDFNRSPRNSITPDATARSPRRSLIPEGTAWNQPRNSLVPDVGRSPRHSVASIQIDPARTQKDIGPSPRTSPRGSIAPDTIPKKDLPDIGRSPRGSIIQDSQRSPRGSIVPSDRSARGSLVAAEAEAARISPRGSLTLTFQEPLVSRERRPSEDSQTAGTRRSVSPYRATAAGRQTGTAAFSDTGSRRASSSVSQVSGDEQRRLCGEQAKYNDRSGMGLGVGLTTYGSVAYQLKDANMEASGTVDFVCRAAQIINRTIVMTVFLACLSTLPVIMLIMGVQYIRDCPAQPRIPVYMVVGGAAGGAGICWLLWAQLASRTANSSASIPERVLAYTLTMFLMGWFAFGNYWVLGIMWPDYAPTLFEPNQWCHKTLYVFALTQLGVVWGVILLLVLLLIALVICQVFGCGWLGPPRYK